MSVLPIAAARKAAPLHTSQYTTATATAAWQPRSTIAIRLKSRRCCAAHDDVVTHLGGRPREGVVVAVLLVQQVAEQQRRAVALQLQAVDQGRHLRSNRCGRVTLDDGQPVNQVHIYTSFI